MRNLVVTFVLLSSAIIAASEKMTSTEELINRYNICSIELDINQTPKYISINEKVSLVLDQQTVKRLVDNISNCKNYVETFSQHYQRAYDYKVFYKENNGCLETSTFNDDVYTLAEKYPNHEQAILFYAPKIYSIPFAFVDSIKSCEEFHKMENLALKETEKMLHKALKK